MARAAKVPADRATRNSAARVPGRPRDVTSRTLTTCPPPRLPARNVIVTTRVEMCGLVALDGARIVPGGEEETTNVPPTGQSGRTLQRRPAPTAGRIAWNHEPRRRRTAMAKKDRDL